MSTDAEHDPAAPGDEAALLADVSNTMARLYADQYGHEPTQVRSHWAGPDALVCILDGTLAVEERNLVKIGGHQLLREKRAAVQYAMRDEYCRPVQRLTGRTLEAFHSSCDLEANGQGVEVFVFHPASYDGPSRIAP